MEYIVFGIHSMIIGCICTDNTIIDWHQLQLNNTSNDHCSFPMLIDNNLYISNDYCIYSKSIDNYLFIYPMIIVFITYQLIKHIYSMIIVFITYQLIITYTYNDHCIGSASIDFNDANITYVICI